MDVVDNNGLTPLYWAIRKERKECACLLINSGARIANVKLNDYFRAIPDWAIAMERKKEACRNTALLLLTLHRKRRVEVFGHGFPVDVMRSIARLVWASRGNEHWAQLLEGN